MRRHLWIIPAAAVGLAPCAVSAQVATSAGTTGVQPSVPPTPRVQSVWVIHVTVDLNVRKVAVDFASEMDAANKAGASLIVVELGADRWRLDIVRDMADTIQKSAAPVAVLLNDGADYTVGIGPLVLGFLATGTSIMPGLVVDHVPPDETRDLAPEGTDWTAIEEDLIARLKPPLDARGIDTGFAEALIRGKTAVWATRMPGDPRPHITLEPPPGYKPPSETPDPAKTDPATAPGAEGAAPASPTPATTPPPAATTPAPAATAPAPAAANPPPGDAGQPATAGAPADTAGQPQAQQGWIAVMLPNKEGRTAMRMEWGIAVGLRIIDNSLTNPDQVWSSRGLSRVTKTERTVNASLRSAQAAAGMILRDGDADLDKIAYVVECRSLDGRTITDTDRFRAGEKALTMFRTARVNMDRWSALVAEYPELLRLKAAKSTNVLGAPPDMVPLGDIFKAQFDRMQALEAEARKNARR